MSVFCKLIRRRPKGPKGYVSRPGVGLGDGGWWRPYNDTLDKWPSSVAEASSVAASVAALDQPTQLPLSAAGLYAAPRSILEYMSRHYPATNMFALRAAPWRGVEAGGGVRKLLIRSAGSRRPIRARVCRDHFSRALICMGGDVTTQTARSQEDWLCFTTSAERRGRERVNNHSDNNEREKKKGVDYLTSTNDNALNKTSLRSLLSASPPALPTPLKKYVLI